MKFLKKLIAPVLACTMLFASACSSKGAKSVADVGSAGLADVEFWSTYSTMKVIQDNVDMYDGIKQPAAINVTAIRGEEEAAQLIMTAGDKPVKEYDVRVSDLSGENGAVFGKAGIKVYHELYITLSTAGEYYTTAGNYPDALVPFENVKAVGENGFDARSNQGLYISFDVPEDQPAGVYTGSIGIVIGGETKTVPVTLTVAAVTIGKKTHVASCFLNEWYFYRGELDTTEEMFDKYNKVLFDYRLGCNNVTTYTDDVEYYAEKCCEYAAIEECAGYNIPHFSNDYSQKPYQLGERQIVGEHAYDVDLLLLYFRTIAEKGLEKGVDPFEKAFAYGFDEPELYFDATTVARYVKEWCYEIKQCEKIVAEELRAKNVPAEKQALLERIAASLEKVPHIMTASSTQGKEIDLSEESMTYVPYFSLLGQEAAREEFRIAEGNQLWWYGCNFPTSPNPTYHIDDTVLSARIESWMKADYNLQGNLYWSTCLYAEESSDPETVVYPENFYTGRADRYPGVAGEGYLFYPGKKYGVDGPVPSLRLEQIRDGLEEYEMIYSLKNIYAEVAAAAGEEYSEEKIMSYIYSRLYSGTFVQTTDEIFENARKNLIELTQLAQSDAKVCLLDVSEGSNYGFKVFAAEGYTPMQGGTLLEGGSAVEGGKVYDLTLDVSKGEKLALSVEDGGKKLTLDMSFGSASETYDARYAFDNDMIKRRSSASSTVATQLVDAAGVNEEAAADEKYVKISLGAATSSAQDFILDSSVIKGINAEDDKLIIRLYNAGAEAELELMIRQGSDSKYVSKSITTLAPGMNNLILSGLGGYNWNKIKSIENVRIRIGAKGDAARDDIYFADMTLYKA